MATSPEASPHRSPLLPVTLLFALGIMNLVWIAVLTVFVLLEKTIPRGEMLARASGIGLIGWGGYVLVVAG